MQKLRILLSYIFRISKGGVTYLSSGNHEMKFCTKWTPSKIWVDLGECCSSPVCGADSDWFDVKTVKGGFILKAKINSNGRLVRWIAFL